MSQIDYELSFDIERGELNYPDPPFYAIVMAAMRRADSTNIAKLALAFPDTHEELVRRRQANFGVLAGEYHRDCGEKATNDKHVCRPEEDRLKDELRKTAEEGAPSDGTETFIYHPQRGYLAGSPYLWSSDATRAFIFASREHAEEFMEGWTLLEGAEVRQFKPQE